MNKDIPILTLEQLNKCKNSDTIIDTVPAIVKCENQYTFNQLIIRYKEIGIAYTADANTLIIKS